MNEVTAKILNILENQSSFAAKDGSGLWHKHGIIYEGSSQMWELLNRTPTCTEFKVGEEASFTTETKVNGNFTNYKIRPKSAAPSGGFKPGFKSGGGGFKQADPNKERRIVLESIFQSICNKTQGSTVTVDQVWSATEKIYDKLMSLSSIPHKSEGAVTPAPVAPVVEVAPAPVPAPVVPKPVVKKAAPVVQPNPLEQFNNEEPDDLPF